MDYINIIEEEKEATFNTYFARLTAQLNNANDKSYASNVFESQFLKERNEFYSFTCGSVTRTDFILDELESKWRHYEMLYKNGPVELFIDEGFPELKRKYIDPELQPPLTNVGRWEAITTIDLFRLIGKIRGFDSFRSFHLFFSENLMADSSLTPKKLVSSWRKEKYTAISGVEENNLGVAMKIEDRLFPWIIALYPKLKASGFIQCKESEFSKIFVRKDDFKPIDWKKSNRSLYYFLHLLVDTYRILEFSMGDGMYKQFESCFTVQQKRLVEIEIKSEFNKVRKGEIGNGPKQKLDTIFLECIDSLPKSVTQRLNKYGRPE